MRLIVVVVLVLLASAPPARAADGERWSGHLFAYAPPGEPPAASLQEPISFVLDPRTRTVRDLEATVLETTRCLPEGEPTNDPETGEPVLPYYSGETVDTVRPRHYSFAGPVKIVDKAFEIGDGRYGGAEDGAAPGSALFSASVWYDPAGNPGQLFAFTGFKGQTLLGGAIFASPAYDGGRCETRLPARANWSVKGPALPRLRLRTTVVRAAHSRFAVTIRVIDRRHAIRGSIVFAKADDHVQKRRTGRDGRARLTVGGSGPVNIGAHARGFASRGCTLQIKRSNPSASRLFC